jgi:hypothetical protein
MNLLFNVRFIKILSKPKVYSVNLLGLYRLFSKLDIRKPLVRRYGPPFLLPVKLRSLDSTRVVAKCFSKIVIDGLKALSILGIICGTTRFAMLRYSCAATERR